MSPRKTTKAKPKASKTAKKTTSAKVTAAGTKTAKSGNLLSRLNLISVLVFAVLAVVAGLLVKDTHYQLTTSYLVKDELVRGSDVFLPAVRDIYSLNIRWALVAILAASAVMPLLVVSILKKRYTNAVGEKIQTLRWIDSAVTWAVVVELVALLSGVSNIMTLKLIAVVVAITMLLGWLSERQNKVSADKTPFMVGLFSSLAVVIALGMALANTYIWGLINLPWYVYGVSGVVLVGLVLWHINHFNYLRGFKSWNKYEVVERNYLIINLATKSFVALALVIGLS